MLSVVPHTPHFPQAPALQLQLPKPPQYTKSERPVEPPPGYDDGSWVTRAPTDGTVQPILKISLDNDQSDLIRTPGDLLIGRLVVTPNGRDLPFERVFIDLQLVESVKAIRDVNYVVGTRVVALAAHHIPATAFPADGVFRNGYQYSFVFSMVIPHTTPAQSCHCEGDEEASHVHLPPSLGVPSEAEHAIAWRKDGKSFILPEESYSSTYRIHARLSRAGDTTGNHSLIARRLHYIRVIPGFQPKQKQLEPVVHTTVYKKLLSRAPPQQVTLSSPGAPVLHLYQPSQWLQFSVDAPVKFGQIKTLAYSLHSSTSMQLRSNRAESAHPETKTHLIYRRSSVEFDTPVWSYDPNTQRKTTGIALPMAIPLTSATIPNFTNCLGRHEYELTLTVEFENSTTAATLKLPVTVSHSRSDEDDQDPVPNYLEEDQPVQLSENSDGTKVEYHAATY